MSGPSTRGRVLGKVLSRKGPFPPWKAKTGPILNSVVGREPVSRRSSRPVPHFLKRESEAR